MKNVVLVFLAGGLLFGAMMLGCEPSFAPQPGVMPGDDNGDSTGLSSELVASGLSRPVFVTSPPNDPTRLFILEQYSGEVRIFDVNRQVLKETPFITVGGLATASEEGLLGLAFAPDYTDSGRFYLNFTRAGAPMSETVIARGVVSVDPDVAEPGLEDLITFAQPFSNHNGGWMGFGPDGFLYVATGDGGSGNDPGNRAQNIDNLRGKLLRLDVSLEEGFTVPASNPFVGADGDDRIWAYGLRNPWRCSFDRETGDLYIADVGQSLIEEINVQPSTVTSAVNYGWPCREGNECLGGRTGCSCDDTSLVGPVHEYGHSSGCSVTGGYVYRGSAIDGLQGTYFLADYCSDDILSLRYDGSAVTDLIDRTEELAPGAGLSIGSISSFGEDACGEIYVCDLAGGEVFKIVPESGITDCNGNRIDDACDIRTGQSVDEDDDGMPDECQNLP
ncbi:MAG: PQQ-dependent sugar dehydrogenase [Planctomycetota bacterium]